MYLRYASFWQAGWSRGDNKKGVVGKHIVSSDRNQRSNTYKYLVSPRQEAQAVLGDAHLPMDQ